MPRLLIVGQAPSRTSNPAEVLRGKSGAKIRELLGLSKRRFIQCTRVNLAPLWTGKDGKGDAFEADPDLVITALSLARDHETVLLLGRAVSGALGYGGYEYFEPIKKEKTTFYVVPHPSGINRWWNDPANRRVAERFFGRLTCAEMKRTRSSQM